MGYSPPAQFACPGAPCARVPSLGGGAETPPAHAATDGPPENPRRGLPLGPPPRAPRPWPGVLSPGTEEAPAALGRRPVKDTTPGEAARARPAGAAAAPAERGPDAEPA